MASRSYDQRRQQRIRANGATESFTDYEIGERDGWQCGICQDTERPVSPVPGTPRALSPSIDHILTVSAGGTHTGGNVRIAHLWCNVERNSGTWHGPEYMRAKLSLVLYGAPIPEDVYRRDRANLHAAVTARRAKLRPGSSAASLTAAAAADEQHRSERVKRQEYVIAIEIATGRIAPDPKYGDAVQRLADIRNRVGEARWDEILASERIRKARLRSKPDSWWRSSK